MFAHIEREAYIEDPTGDLYRTTKGGETVAENEKQSIRNMEAAIADLPEEKKQYFLGYAEGVAAMAEQVKAKEE